MVYKAQSSRAVELPLGLDSLTLSLESPTTVGMPVWLKVSGYGWDQAIRYPFDIHPADFTCHDVEVRRDRKPLPRFASIESKALYVALSG